MSTPTPTDGLEESKGIKEESLKDYLAIKTAIERENVEDVKKYFKVKQINPNFRTSDGSTLLSYALGTLRSGSSKEKEKILTLLIEAGAIPQTEQENNELMFFVTKFGMMKVIKALHEKRFDLSKKMDVSIENVVKMLGLSPDLTQVIQILFKENSKFSLLNIGGMARLREVYKEVTGMDLVHQSAPMLKLVDACQQMNRLSLPLSTQTYNLLDMFLQQGHYYAAKLLRGYGVVGLRPESASLLESITFENGATTYKPTMSHFPVFFSNAALAQKLSKYLIHSSKPLRELPKKAPYSVFDIIASRTFSDDASINDSIIKTIEEMCAEPNYTVLFQALAEHFLENKRANIIFYNSNSPRLETEGDMGFYNLKSSMGVKVRMSSATSVSLETPEILKSTRGSFVHEVGHYVRNIVHRNQCNPYGAEDTTRLKLLSEAIKTCLFNLRATFITTSKEKSEDEKFSSTYQIGKDSFRAFQIFELSDRARELDVATKVVLTRILDVYNYLSFSEHKEFIVRYNQLQEELGSYHPALELLKPLKTYLDEQELPLFRNYIETHPQKSKIVFLPTGLERKIAEESFVTAGAVTKHSTSSTSATTFKKAYQQLQNRLGELQHEVFFNMESGEFDAVVEDELMAEINKKATLPDSVEVLSPTQQQILKKCKIDVVKAGLDPIGLEVLNGALQQLELKRKVGPSAL